MNQDNDETNETTHSNTNTMSANKDKKSSQRCVTQSVNKRGRPRKQTCSVEVVKESLDDEVQSEEEEQEEEEEEEEEDDEEEENENEGQERVETEETEEETETQTGGERVLSTAVSTIRLDTSGHLVRLEDDDYDN